MNILDQFVIPPNLEHVGLLSVMQIISLLTFLPFAGIMLGASVFSVYFNKKGKKTGNPLFTKIAKDIMNKLTVGKSVGLSLAVLPLLTIVLIYAQMLYGAGIFIVGSLSASLVLYVVSFVFMYIYKSTLRLGSLVVLLLFISSFLFIAGTTVTDISAVGAEENGIFKLLLSAPIWINYLFFISTSFAITGGAILYFFFVWQGGIADASEEYKETVKKFAVVSAFVSSLVQPVFIFAGTLFMPLSGSSSGVYVFAGFTLLVVFLICNLLYYVYKNSDMRLSGAVFFLMFIVLTFVIVKDQLAFKNSIKTHLLILNGKSEMIAKEKESKIIQVNAADGEKIYNEKCVACHKFDVKLVGPPYQETIPKYNGDLKKLAGFVYNPQKVNPSYPSMPNQGLKMKEAEAVAKYIMDKIGKK